MKHDLVLGMLGVATAALGFSLVSFEMGFLTSVVITTCGVCLSSIRRRDIRNQEFQEEQIASTRTLLRDISRRLDVLLNFHESHDYVARIQIAFCSRVNRIFRDPAQRFESEDECFAYLTREVRMLSGIRGSEVRAVCSDKSWGSPAVESYWEANVAAVESGNVRIERIFLEVNRRVRRAAREQATKGIAAFVVPAEHLPNLVDLAGIPSDVGFAVLDAERVVIHWGVGDAAQGALYKSPELAHLMVSVCDTLKMYSERAR